MARLGTAAANVGHKNAAGVDLAQLYEQRAGSTAIANVGFKDSGGVDLAQIFRDIAAISFPLTARTCSTIRTSGAATATYQLQSTGDVFVAGTSLVDSGED